MRVPPLTYLILPPLLVIALWFLKEHNSQTTVTPEQTATVKQAGDLVTNVVDGDTFDIGDRRVRLWGVDAPASGQKCYAQEGYWQCGQSAASELTKKILGKIIACELKYRDRNQREVSQCRVDGEDVAAFLVKFGWAVDWPKYSSGHYAELEISARTQNVGIYRK